MRLIHRWGHWQIQVTFPWEAAYLAEQGERWLPFCLLGHADIIGEVHAATQQVRLYPGVVLADRQAIALAPLGGAGQCSSGENALPGC